MNPQFSFKEIYDVILTAPYDMTINDREIVQGEVIAAFDKIVVSNFNEVQSTVKATGGYNNATLITWQYTKELSLNFTSGIFNHEQFGLLTNANLINRSDESIYIHQRETVATNSDGSILLKYYPVISKHYYAYDYDSGEKLEVNENPQIEIQGSQYKVYADLDYPNTIVVDYTFDYNSSFAKNIVNMEVGNHLLDGVLELEGKTKVQEDETGNYKTCIIKIPRLKLMSNLSIRLGQNAQPIVGNFQALALPTGERGNEKVMDFLFLEDDIDSDM